MEKEKQMNIKKKSAFSVAICILYLFVIFASLFYIVEEVNHDCTGEDCPVCTNIQQAEQIIRNLSTGMIVHAIVNRMPIIFVLVIAGLVLLVSRTSLISQKVRLNN